MHLAKHMLNDPWPSFFDFIDSNPRKSGDAFCAEALKYMDQCQPYFLRMFPPEEWSDVKHEICLHFIDNNLRVLRKYRRSEKGFGAWFYVTAYNRARDVLRQRKRNSRASEWSGRAQADDPPGGETVVIPVSPSQEARGELSKVLQVIKSMDQYCQLLLRFGAQEFKPQEIARALSWPVHKAKKISDDLSYCREKLVRLLNDGGINTLRATS